MSSNNCFFKIMADVSPPWHCVNTQLNALKQQTDQTSHTCWWSFSAFVEKYMAVTYSLNGNRSSNSFLRVSNCFCTLKPKDILMHPVVNIVYGDNSKLATIPNQCTYLINFTVTMATILLLPVQSYKYDINRLQWITIEYIPLTDNRVWKCPLFSYIRTNCHFVTSSLNNLCCPEQFIT